MNIVYGGSFNPPTLAHYAIIKKLIEQFKPDNFIILPVGNSYKRKTDLVEIKHRVNMLEIATSDLNVKISLIEANLKEYKGTYYILEQLSKEYNDLYFVMGADNLNNIETWINYELLIKKYKFIVITRDEHIIENILNEKVKDFSYNFEKISLNVDISSSKVRQNIHTNKIMLDERVYDYIVKNNLYESD